MNNSEINKLYNLAQRGNPDAIYELACRQLKGDGVGKDPQAAYDNFCMLAENGYENAQVQMAKMCCYGYLGENEVANGAQILINAAEDGNPVAQYELAYIYEKGIGCKVNRQNAIDLYEESARAGYSPARSALQRMRYHNQTQSKNISNYVRTTEQQYNNANEENVESMIALARHYAGGAISKDMYKKYKGSDYVKQAKSLFTTADMGTAILYYEKAIQHGSTEVYLEVSMVYAARAASMLSTLDLQKHLFEKNAEIDKTRAVLKDDIDTAIKYGTLAIERDLSSACNTIVVACEAGVEIFYWLAIDDLFVEKQYKVRGISNLSLSTSECAEASKFLATNTNFKLACNYCKIKRSTLEKLALGGDISAQLKLGITLKKGDCLGSDWKAGERWLKTAAESGDPIAMVEYSDYLFGFYGGSKNITKALELLEKAADSGNPKCICALAYTLAYGIGSQRSSYDLNRAISLYEQLCNKGVAQAMRELADLYKDPRTKNDKRHNSLQLYKRAAELGDDKARRILSESYNYNYTKELLSTWFVEQLKKDVVGSSLCPHCGSGLRPISKRFLGQFYSQCPICNGKYTWVGLTKIKL